MFPKGWAVKLKKRSELLSWATLHGPVKYIGMVILNLKPMLPMLSKKKNKGKNSGT